MSHAPNSRMQSDRFAREIMAILALGYAARLRRLSFIVGRHSLPLRRSLSHVGATIVTPLLQQGDASSKENHT
jgi:hypothetical protein